MTSLLIVVVVALTVISGLSIAVKRTRRYPAGSRPVPGPPGLPLIGNTLQIPPNNTHRVFMRWAEEYGEIYKVQLGWNDWYMLNSPAAVKDIMDRQSVHTSSRTPMPVASTALSGDRRLLFMPYGTEWRRLRTVVHKLLTPRMTQTFQPSQEFESLQLINDILDDNQDLQNFYMHIRRYTVSVIMTSTYGRRIPKWDCEDVREVYGLMKDFSEVAAPGAYLADTIPPLGQLLPEWAQWWRKSVLPLQDRQSVLWMRLWTDLKTKMETQQAPECFVKQFIESDYQKENISELQAAYVAGSMIEAGSETTSAALNSAMLYLSAHPSVQARAHAELDTVVGHERSPTFSDEEQLPYIRCIIKEILRLRPVTNMGTPHYTSADIMYKDYFIPKGSVVAIQQYAIHYDPDRYPDPAAFKPERYANHHLKSGAYAAGNDPYERDHFSFGAGRRICTGLHLAESSLYITLAKILWAFNILPPIDAEKRVMPVDCSDDAYEPGANTLPKPFACRFVPRNAGIEQVMREEWAKARKDGFLLREKRVDVEGIVVN